MSIYIVTPKTAEDGKPVPARLVRAVNQAQVRKHITDAFNVAVASQDDLVKATKDGVAVEEARDAE